MTHWLNRIGQADGDTFASLIAKLGNNTTAFWAAIGYEGATSLAAKLTAARAALLDQITALRMAELDAGNLPADINTLLARLTAVRAGYLDELDFDLNARLGTPAGASLAADLLTIDNLVDDLEARLTALRAGYLDNLSGGAVALAASWTAALATALGNYTAARAGYLDNINQAGLLSLTAARAARLDFLITAEIAATFSKVDDILEQTIFTFNPAGLRTEVMGIWLDLVNLTQNATIRTKFQIDGVTYRTFDPLSWVTTDDDGVFITGFPVNNNVQVSVQSAVLEGVARNIPYLILYRTVE